MNHVGEHFWKVQNDPFLKFVFLKCWSGSRWMNGVDALLLVFPESKHLAGAVLFRLLGFF